jgi:hypothetical protein
MLPRLINESVRTVFGASAGWNWPPPGLLHRAIPRCHTRRVPDLLRAMPPGLEPERVAWPTRRGCASAQPPSCRHGAEAWH